jgi:hypothetical protein
LKESKKIMNLQFNLIRQRLADRHIKLGLTAAAKEHVVVRVATRVRGALSLRQFLQRHIGTALPRKILVGHITDSSRITVNFKKKPGMVVECRQGQTMNPAPLGPVSDSKNATASVADSASAEPVILDEDLATQKDQYLRLAADFDNFKKRTRRDSERQAVAEKEAFIYDLLPVIEMVRGNLAVVSTPGQGITVRTQIPFHNGA